MRPVFGDNLFEVESIQRQFLTVKYSAELRSFLLVYPLLRCIVFHQGQYQVLPGFVSERTSGQPVRDTWQLPRSSFRERVPRPFVPWHEPSIGFPPVSKRQK